jgi:hypothetical protein
MMREKGFRAKSDNSLISRASIAAALASLILVLSACPPPGSSDEGPPPKRISADFSVTETIPPDGAKEFDPGQAIVVKFNKDLDPACLDKLPNKIDTATMSFSIPENDPKTLLIEPHPYLESNHSYTVTFNKTALMNDSGEALPKDVVLSFTTGDQLAGDVTIGEVNVKQYTNRDSVTLNLQYNGIAPSVQAHIANSGADLLSGPYVTDEVSGDTAYSGWPLDPNVQGPQTVYVQYVYGSQKSAIRSATVVHDTVKPVIDPPNVAQYYNMYNVPSNPDFVPFVASCNATDPDNTSGIRTYAWTCAGVPYNVQSPTVTIDGPDDDYPVTLTVTDRAGNQSVWPPPQETRVIAKDTNAPAAPTVGALSSSLKSPLKNPDNISWEWTASSSQDSVDFVVKLDTETAWHHVPLNSPSWDASNLGDGNFWLAVRQVDVAGNQSPDLRMQIIVTPVLPLDEAIVVNWNPPELSWRNFGPDPEQAYTIHYGTLNDGIFSQIGPDHDVGANFHYQIQNGLLLNTQYSWYIEWPNGGRSPPSQPPDRDQYYSYYHFTLQ